MNLYDSMYKNASQHCCMFTIQYPGLYEDVKESALRALWCFYSLYLLPSKQSEPMRRSEEKKSSASKVSQLKLRFIAHSIKFYHRASDTYKCLFDVIKFCYRCARADEVTPPLYTSLRCDIYFYNSTLPINCQL